MVPDRHVTKILALFNLNAQSLSLPEEEFRQHCFELSLQQSKGQNDKEQKSLLRLEKVTQRKLSIATYSASKNSKRPFFFSTALITVALGGLFIYANSQNFWQSSSSSQKSAANNIKCWAGYSSSLGDFEQVDNADPCHYGKLLHRALVQLAETNESEKLSNSSENNAPSQAYLLFLSEQLDLRRINDKITLNVELGKSEFRRLNYSAAQKHFHIASNLLAATAKPNIQVMAEISVFNTKIKSALNATGKIRH